MDWHQGAILVVESECSFESQTRRILTAEKSSITKNDHKINVLRKAESFPGLARSINE